ncbi:MAG: response regulator [Fidelibacterota bacterium]
MPAIPDEKKLVTVLAVEDNPANMNYLLFILKKLNISTVAAASGEEAIDIMKLYRFKCGLFDINLGEGMSGLHLMEIVRQEEEYKNIPIIAVTAYYGGGMHKKLLNRGFTDYLSKPYDLPQLQELLKQYLSDL